MYRKHKIGVVVPAYNERELIAETLAGIPSFVDKVYVIDDASTDGTGDVVERFAANDERISLITHETNGGVGAAILSGYRRVLEDRLSVVAVMAGDNQMDPAQLPRLLDPIIDGRADYAKGNRLVNREYARGMSRWRLFGNTLLTLLTKVASGYWQLMDPQNGYTAISRRALERIPLDSVYPWYGYCNDLLVKLNVYGFKVVDVPMPARYGREKSKIRYGKYILKVSWLLLRDFLWRLRMKYLVLNFHPLVLLYALGLLLTPAGLVGTLLSVCYQSAPGESLLLEETFWVPAFMAGFMSLAIAMLLDVRANVHPVIRGRTYEGFYHRQV